MKTLKNKLPILLASLMICVPFAANAEEVCTSGLDAIDEINKNLIADINSAEFLGKNSEMDRKRLRSKAEAAQRKIGQMKYDDAMDKLGEISDKVADLGTAAKPKINGTDGMYIMESVEAAEACVNDFTSS